MLGTLPAEERARFAERMRGDPALRAEVRRLQARLSPLDDTAPPEMPRPRGLARDRAADVGGAAARRHRRAAPTGLERRRSCAESSRSGAARPSSPARSQRGLRRSLSSTGCPFRSRPAGGRYVAVVDTGGHEPALIAEVDTTTGIIRVRSLAAETPAGRSLELWHVPEGQAPRSLGILQAGLNAQTVKDLGRDRSNGIIAVSVEPEGGSPSGAPTGPIVYTGRLDPGGVRRPAAPSRRCRQPLAVCLTPRQGQTLNARRPADMIRRGTWGRSSAGRAPRSQCGGQGFDPPRLHQLTL